MKYYKGQDIAKDYNDLSTDKKNEILSLALDYMRQNNARSKFLCIAFAMGYDNQEMENGTYFKRPYEKTTQIKENKLLTTLEIVQKSIEHIINATPSGTIRNLLTDVNISVMTAIENENLIK